MTKDLPGIVAAGAYLPVRRLQREAVFAANGWFNAALRAQAKGERTMCNWDEDSITMAVEASRHCLENGTGRVPEAVYFCTTTPPFLDRLNGGVVSAALGLPAATAAMDVTGAQKCAVSALIAAAKTSAADGSDSLVVGSDRRLTKAGSAQELLYGDGAAAILVGHESPAAEFVAVHQVTDDFVDHFRGTGSDFDYGWEERWVRDQGYFEIVPDAVRALLEKARLAPGDVDHFILPCTLRGAAKGIAQRVGLDNAELCDALGERVGDTGAAHPLLMLIEVLERAKPDAVVVVAAFGQGCDLAALRVTGRGLGRIGRLGVGGQLRRGRPEPSYQRFLAFRDLLPLDRGIRAEFTPLPALSALFRNRRMLLGLYGGMCRECGTAQIPKTDICVNPNCRAEGSQDDHRFADRRARLQSWTADNLTYTPDPPMHFGMVTFDDGGRMMTDITDAVPGEVESGAPVRMVFRVRHRDAARGFVHYFWKAAPADAAEAGNNEVPST